MRAKGQIQVLLVFEGNKQVTVPPRDHAHQVKPQKRARLDPLYSQSSFYTDVMDVMERFESKEPNLAFFWGLTWWAWSPGGTVTCLLPPNPNKI